MLEWQASMLCLAAAAKEAGLQQTKGTAWLIKLTYQVSVCVRRKITCLGNAAFCLGIINISACWCQSRESRQCRCKHPRSCACSQQERIRQGRTTTGAQTSISMVQLARVDWQDVSFSDLFSLFFEVREVDESSFSNWSRIWENVTTLRTSIQWQDETK